MSVPPLNIIVFWDSHVFWLNSFICSDSLAERYGELQIESRACHVEYLAIRGATAATFLTPTMRAQIDSFHPDAAVICLGGNSISGSGPPDLVMVAIDIPRLVARLVQSGVSSVAVCQVVRRLKWRNASFEVGAARVDQLNSHLKAFSDDMPFVFFWRHKRLWSSTMSIFRGTDVILMMPGTTSCFEVFEARSWPRRGHFAGTSLKFSSSTCLCLLLMFVYSMMLNFYNLDIMTFVLNLCCC